MKYGLSIDGAEGLIMSPSGFVLFTKEEAQEYVELVQVCHDFVESYLDDNPDVASQWGQDGFRYYDILKLASPEYDKKVLEWSRDYERRRQEYMKKAESWDSRHHKYSDYEFAKSRPNN